MQIPAVFYHPEAFDISASSRIMGRQSAGEGFLHALFRHRQAGSFSCYAETEPYYRHFCNQLERIAPGKRADWIPCHSPDRLAGPGNLFISAPGIGPHAWRRQQHGTAAYSLTGITHTVCSITAINDITGLLQAPIRPWDALVCTSTAVRQVVLDLFGQWETFQRVQHDSKAEFARPQLPVIPLGVDCKRYASGTDRDDRRRKFRQERQIRDDELVFLNFGRMSIHAKAHPLPLFLALEETARRLRIRPVLLMAGWAANETILKAYIDGAKQFCPSVRLLIVDARHEGVAERVWAAADVFCSLADNIQESFGLTPVEAQAAGLPVVVSDWDGYRDTVVDGETGFRIPTLMPGPGMGELPGWRYQSGHDNYDKYVGLISQCVVVDIDRLIEACVSLAGNPSLRQSLGEAGRRRAGSVYDWPVVLESYQQLWNELRDQRLSAAAQDGDTRPQTLPFDPFCLFAGYATALLQDTDLLLRADGDPRILYRQRTAPFVNRLAGEILASEKFCLLLFDRMDQAGTPLRVADVVPAAPGEGRATAVRTLCWLAKLGIIRISHA